MLGLKNIKNGVLGMLEFYIISNCPSKGLYRNSKKAKREFQKYPEAKMQKFFSPTDIPKAMNFCNTNDINVKKEEWEDLLTAGRMSQFAQKGTIELPQPIREKLKEETQNNPSKPPAFPQDAEVVIYTDGSYIENQMENGKILKAGGYAAIMVMRKVYDAEIAISGHSKKATDSYYMEMVAITKALSKLKKYNITGKVHLFSDLQSLVTDYNRKLAGWQECGWKKANGKHIKNWKLWRKIWKKTRGITLQVHWIKGHSKNKYNNRCDLTAYAEARLQMNQLENGIIKNEEME